MKHFVNKAVVAVMCPAVEAKEGAGPHDAQRGSCAFNSDPGVPVIRLKTMIC